MLTVGLRFKGCRQGSNKTEMQFSNIEKSFGIGTFLPLRQTISYLFPKRLLIVLEKGPYHLKKDKPLFAALLVITKKGAYKSSFESIRMLRYCFDRSKVSVVSISLRSLPGRKTMLALSIIEEVNFSACSAPSPETLIWNEPKSPIRTI